MNRILKTSASRGRTFAAALVFFTAGTLVLPAQSGPAGAEAPSTASLNQNVQSLQRQVSQLQSQVDLLTQQNDRLQKQVLTSQEINNLIQASVQNAIAKSRSEINTDVGRNIDSANENLRKQIMADTTDLIKKLAADTDTQLKKLAAAISEKPVVTSVNTTPPKPLPANTKVILYKVLKGDSFSGIAGKNHISIAELQAANPQVKDPKYIKEGDILGIPQREGMSTPSAASGN